MIWKPISLTPVAIIHTSNWPLIQLHVGWWGQSWSSSPTWCGVRGVTSSVCWCCSVWLSACPSLSPGRLPDKVSLHSVMSHLQHLFRSPSLGTRQCPHSGVLGGYKPSQFSPVTSVIQNLADNHGAFGDFIISRNVTTQEGCTVCCKYRIHYDRIHNSTNFIGRRNGPKCVRQVLSWPAQAAPDGQTCRTLSSARATIPSTGGRPSPRSSSSTAWGSNTICTLSIPSRRFPSLTSWSTPRRAPWGTATWWSTRHGGADKSVTTGQQ